MQNVLVTVLLAADVLVALIIIALVLVQQSKEGAFGSPFGGVGESVFGAHAGSHLAKLTVIFSVLFLSITLILAIIIGHRAQPRGIVERELSLMEKTKITDVKPVEENKETQTDVKQVEGKGGVVSIKVKEENQSTPTTIEDKEAVQNSEEKK